MFYSFKQRLSYNLFSLCGYLGLYSFFKILSYEPHSFPIWLSSVFVYLLSTCIVVIFWVAEEIFPKLRCVNILKIINNKVLYSVFFYIGFVLFIIFDVYILWLLVALFFTVG